MSPKRRRATASALLDVLRLVAEGYTNERIGRALGISPEAVKWRVLVLRREFRARDRAHAVAIGYREGYLGLGEHAKSCALRKPRVCDCEGVER